LELSPLATVIIAQLKNRVLAHFERFDIVLPIIVVQVEVSVALVISLAELSSSEVLAVVDTSEIGMITHDRLPPG
jgi:hypothetical protein